MTAPDETSLEEAVHRRARALGQGDRERLEALMHPDALWTTHTGLVLDRDSYIGRNTRTVKWHSQDVRIERLLVADAIGIVLAVVDDVVDADLTAERFTMRVSMVWRHFDDGGWRLLVAHAGPRIDAESRPQ